MMSSTDKSSIPVAKNSHFVGCFTQQGAQKVKVLCDLWKTQELGQFFFDDHMIGDT